MAEEAITSTILAKKNIDTVNKTEKSQAFKKTVDTSKIDKTDIVKTIGKSRSTKITDTVKTKYKSRYIPGNN